MSDTVNFQKWVKNELIPVLNELGRQVGNERAVKLSFPSNTIPTEGVDQDFMNKKFLSIEEKIRPRKI